MEIPSTKRSPHLQITPKINNLTKKLDLHDLASPKSSNKLAPLQSKESISPTLSILKKDIWDFRHVVNLSISSNFVSPTAGKKKSGSFKDRLQTLKIFQKRTKNEGIVDEPSTIGKKGPDGIIKYGDSEVTIKALVDESKKDYTRKKKVHLRGSMYINDLWGQLYEREVIKQARIDQDLEKERKTTTEKFQQQIAKISQTHQASEQDITPNAMNSMKAKTFSESFSQSLRHELSKHAPRERNLHLSSKVSQNFRGLNDENTSTDYYGITPPKKNCESTPRSTKVSNFFPYSHSKTQEINHTKDSLPNLRIPILSEESENIESVENNHRKLKIKLDHHSSTSEISHYGLTPISTARTSERPERSSKSFRGRNRDNFKKSNKNKLSLTEDRETSNETTSDKKHGSLSRGAEASKTKVFLSETNGHFNSLIGCCETELEEKEDWLNMIHGLKGLFLIKQFDHGKKFENLKKEKLIRDCRNLIKKRGQSSSDGSGY